MRMKAKIKKNASWIWIKKENPSINCSCFNKCSRCRKEELFINLECSLCGTRIETRKCLSFLCRPQLTNKIEEEFLKTLISLEEKTLEVEKTYGDRVFLKYPKPKREIDRFGKEIQIVGIDLEKDLVEIL